MSIEYFDFSVATGASRQIDCRADFVRYMAGSAGGADESIIIKSAQGGIEVKLKPGQSFKIDTPQVRWFVQGVSGNTVIGEILFAEGGTFDDATVAGTVSIIDGGKTKTLSGNQFSGVSSINALAANYSYASIFNPAGSGKKIAIKSFSASCGVADTILIGFYAGSLATNSGNFKSKLAGGANSTAQGRTEQVTTDYASIGATAINRTEQGSAGPSTSYAKTFSEPLILPEGYSLIARPSTLNNAINLSLEFSED